MRKKLKAAISHPIVSGSFLIFAGGMIANILSFVFNLFMSRNLAVSQYGTLVSLISIITLCAIPAGALTPTIVSVSGTYFVKNDNSSLHDFFIKMFRILLLAGFIFTIFSIIFSKQIGTFLNIKSPVILIFTGIAILMIYLTSLFNAFMQGKLSFSALSLSTSSSALLKLIFGIVVVIFGLGLNGAVLSYLISFLLPIIIGIFILRKFLFFPSSKETKISYRELVSFGIPSAIVIFSLNSLISTDIILVKHLFSEQQAGLYAGLSLVGRVIFYATAPIGTVMFPTFVNRYNKEERLNHILFGALALVGLGSALVTAFYFMFPSFVLLLFLKNTQYLQMIPYLGKFGVFITLYSMLSIFSYYFLSIKKTKISYLLIFGAITQAVLIYFIHSNIGEIINISLVTTGILLALFLLYFKFGMDKEKS